MRFFKVTSALLLMMSFLVFTGFSCTKGKQSAPQASQTSTPSESTDAAAIVNGSSIPMSELRMVVSNLVKQNGMDVEKVDTLMAQFGSNVLKRLIDGELLFQAAQDGGFLASKEDVDSMYEKLASQYDDPAKFQSDMKTRGFTEASLKTYIQKQLSIQEYIEKTIVPKAIVPEETVRKAYDQNPQNFVQKEEVRASHILISSSASDPKEKRDAALKKAKKVAALAKAKGADFAELAKKYSDGPSGPSGGDLGFFSRGRMVKAFEDAAFSMKVNEVSDPILTQFGYHIIKVTDRHEGKTIPFEDVKAKLTKDLKSRMVNELVEKELAGLKEKAKIQILFKPPTPKEAPGEVAPGETGSPQ